MADVALGSAFGCAFGSAFGSASHLLVALTVPPAHAHETHLLHLAHVEVPCGQTTSEERCFFLSAFKPSTALPVWETIITGEGESVVVLLQGNLRCES